MALTPNRHSNVSIKLIPMGTCCYMDGSKHGDRKGLGLLIEQPEIRLCLRLTDRKMVLKAKVCAIREYLI